MNPWQMVLVADDEDRERDAAAIVLIEAACTQQDAERLAGAGERVSCRCPRPAVDDDRCVWCGREPERVIA